MIRKQSASQPDLENKPLDTLPQEAHCSLPLQPGEMLDEYRVAWRIQQEARDIRAGKVKTRPLGEFMEELGIR